MPEQPTLRAMIQKEVDKGVTYAELEERARNPETGASRISDSQLHRIAKGTATRIPTEEQLRGIADALRLRYPLVRRVAIDEWFPAEEEVPRADDERDQLRTAALELRNQLTTALDRIDQLDDPHPSKRPKSA